MVTGDFWVLLAMLLYFIVVVLIGFVYAKKSNASSEAYFLGGRGLGPWLTALSAEASDMSGWLLMGPSPASRTSRRVGRHVDGNRPCDRHVSQLEVRGEASAQVL